MQRGKTSENFRGRKKCSQMIFPKISQKIEDITFTLDFRVFLDMFEIFTEDCFLPRSFRKSFPSGFLSLSRFRRTPKSTHHPHKIDDQHRECKTGGGA